MKTNKKIWTETEDEYLVNNYYTTKNEVLAKRLGRTVHSVKCRLSYLRDIGKIKAAKYSQTGTNICFSCQRAAGKNMCRWARELKPVKGWEAEKVNILMGGVVEETYHITDCPLYAPDAARGKSEGEEAKNKSMKHGVLGSVKISLFKDGKKEAFKTMSACASYLANETGANIKTLMWYMVNRKKEILGYTVDYEKNGEKC